ncbi:hypothetical protein HZC07_06325 [Candidatus Micrarchaeota archaeon]|nr:hypothetical protein [Candidatus Micrarchaeota archaeon]
MERNIPRKIIEKMVNKCVRLTDPESGQILCVYKEKAMQYYTLVLDESSDQIAVITAYLSGKWQIEQYEKVKKHERSKLR